MGTTPSKRLSKLEPVDALAFQGLSAGAKAKLCEAALWRYPRFAFEVAASEEPSFAFTRHSSDYGYGDGVVLASSALKSGHMALARSFFKRACRSSGALEARELKAVRGRYMAFALNAMEGAGSDEDVWRALGWLKGYCAVGPRTTEELAGEIACALGSGRPMLGARLCADLLKRDSGEIAAATAAAESLPKEMWDMKIDWIQSGEARAVDAHGWIEALRAKEKTRLAQTGSSLPPTKPMSFTEIKTGAVLELAAFWSDKFEQARAEASDPKDALLHKSRSEALREVGNALWRKGALSSPNDYAERFERSPFGDAAPQIKALQAMSEERRSILIHKAWSQAARWAYGSKPKREAPGLWDRFVQTHQGLGLGVGPNPFEAASSGQTPAMWSLSGDASLIGMGIARGFDPKLQERLVARPGALGAAALDPASLEPRWEWWNSWDRKQSAALRIAQVQSKSAQGARAPKAGSIDAKTGWVNTNLASLALAAGFQEQAKALMIAGCSAADVAPVCAELSSLGGRAHEMDRIQAYGEAFALRASLEADQARKTKNRKKPAGTQDVELAAPKRRLLKA